MSGGSCHGGSRPRGQLTGGGYPGGGCPGDRCPDTSTYIHANISREGKLYTFYILFLLDALQVLSVYFRLLPFRFKTNTHFDVHHRVDKKIN